MNKYTKKEYKLLGKKFKEEENIEEFFYFMAKSFIDKAMEAIENDKDPTEHFLNGLPEKSLNAMYHDPIEKIPLLLNDRRTSFLKTIVTWRCEIGR
jgi:hypothetical protein